MNATKTRVTIDGMLTVDAVDRGERWNGWVVPYLDAEAIAAWQAWTDADGEWDVRTEITEGVLTVREDGEVSQTVTAESDGTFRFDLGLVWDLHE